MGKYAATKGISYSKSGKAFKNTVNAAFDSPADEGSYRFQSFLYGADPTGIYRGYVQSRDSTNYLRDYMRNYGLKWSDIKYPSRIYGFGNDGSFGRAAFMTSANIARLYL